MKRQERPWKQTKTEGAMGDIGRPIESRHSKLNGKKCLEFKIKQTPNEPMRAVQKRSKTGTSVSAAS